MSETLAESYERLAVPLTGPFSRHALRLAALPPRSKILDVAAGTGAFSVPAAQAGHAVLAVDLAPAMVAHLTPKLAPYPGCAARTGRCEALDLPDASQDAAVSIFGVAIVPVWRAGLAEMIRVTRPRGLIVLGAWPGDIGATPMVVLRDTFHRCFPQRPFWPETPFPPWTAEGLREALLRAGCATAEVSTVTTDYVQASAEILVATSMPFFRSASGVMALDMVETAHLETELIGAFRAYANDEGEIHLPVEALIGVGRKIG